MELIKLEAKFDTTESLEEIFAEIIREIKEDYQSNYDGITENEDYSYNIKTVSKRFSINHLEQNEY